MQRYRDFCSACGRAQRWNDLGESPAPTATSVGGRSPTTLPTAPGVAPTSTRRGFPARSRSRRPADSGWTPAATGAAAVECSIPCDTVLVQPPPELERGPFLRGESPHCSRGVDDRMNACPWCGGDPTGRDLIPRALTRVRRLLLVSRIKDWGYRVLLRPGSREWTPCILRSSRSSSAMWWAGGGETRSPGPCWWGCSPTSWDTASSIITGSGPAPGSSGGRLGRWTRRTGGWTILVYFQRRRIAIAPTNFVSAYAAKHPQEDFAETFRFYVTRRGRLRDLFGELVGNAKALFSTRNFWCCTTTSVRCEDGEALPLTPPGFAPYRGEHSHYAGVTRHSSPRRRNPDAPKQRRRATRWLGLVGSPPVRRQPCHSSSFRSCHSFGARAYPGGWL